MKDGEGVRETRSTARLKSLEVCANARVPVRKFTWANACEELVTGFPNLVSITGSTNKFINNARTELSFYGSDTLTLNIFKLVKSRLLHYY